MKLIVTGGRSFNRVAMLHAALSHLQPTLVIHGDCPSGADSIADEWARSNHVKRDPLPADWLDMSPPCRIKWSRNGPYNALAGFKRNRTLLTRGAEAVLGTEGGPGTHDMLQRAYRAGLPIYLLRGNYLETPMGERVALALVGDVT